MNGFSFDDPMLALITRFAACCEDPEVSEGAFLRHQCERIREYVKDVSEDQRQERALEWITRNAEDYRQKWHESVVAKEAAASRCADCPLQRRNKMTTCEIHQRWLELLNQYVVGGISSKSYVVDTLNLLRQHKERLKIRVSQGPSA